MDLSRTKFLTDDVQIDLSDWLTCMPIQEFNACIKCILACVLCPYSLFLAYIELQAAACMIPIHGESAGFMYLYWDPRSHKNLKVINDLNLQFDFFFVPT